MTARAIHTILLTLAATQAAHPLCAGIKNCRTATQVPVNEYKGRVKQVKAETYLAVKSGDTYRPDSTTRSGRQARTSLLKHYNIDGSISLVIEHSATDEAKYTTCSYPAIYMQEELGEQVGHAKSRTRNVYAWISDNEYKVTHYTGKKNRAFIDITGYDMVSLDSSCAISGITFYTPPFNEGIENSTHFVYITHADTTVLHINSGDERNIGSINTEVLARDSYGNPATVLTYSFSGTAITYYTYKYYAP